MMCNEREVREESVMFTVRSVAKSAKVHREELHRLLVVSKI